VTSAVIGGGSAGRAALFPAKNGITSTNQKKSSSSTSLYSSLAITGALTALDAFCQSSPYAAAAIICGFKASAADMVAQKRDFRKREEKRLKKAAENEAAAMQLQQSTTEDAVYNPAMADAYGSGAAAGALQLEATPSISNTQEAADSTVTAQNEAKKADWKRNIAFLVYGSLYQGVTQEFVYNHLYPVWFGSATTISVVLTKVLFDLLVQTTMVTLPIAYLTKSVIYRYSFKEAMRRYIDDIKNHGLLKKYFLLWGPVQCCTFSIVPEHWRVTFIACVSFFWLIILSTISSKAPKKAAAVPAVEECSLEDGLTCNIDG